MLAERYQKAELRFKAIEDDYAKRTSKRQNLTAFATRLMESDEKITEFTPPLWNAMVEKVLIATNGTLCFNFRNSTETSVLTAQSKPPVCLSEIPKDAGGLLGRCMFD